MKKTISFMLVLLIPFLLFSQASLEKQSPDTTLTFTDSLGRTRQIPTNLERIVPSGNVAQIVLYTIAPDLMVGNSTEYTDSAEKYLLESNVKLPILGAFYGKKANLNKEALIVANPQVVIDFGEIKGSKENMINDLDALEKQINIPVVFIETYLEKTADSYRMLGKLLNREGDTEKLALYSQKAISTAKEKAGKLDRKVRVYYSSSVDGLDAVASNSFHGEVLNLVNAENVVPPVKGSGANQISLEQLYIYNPEVILLENPDAYNTVIHSPLWSKIDAVKNNKVYLLPNSPYNWIDSPPSINRLIGIYYLGHLLYPELYSDIDLKTEIKEFFSLFYKYDLSDEQALSFIP